MRALGRRSLSSVLKVLTDAAYFGLMIVGGLMVIVYSVGGMTASGWTWEEYPVSLQLADSADDPTPGEGVRREIVDGRGTVRVSRPNQGFGLARLLPLAPLAGALLVVLGRLRRVFRRLRDERPFDPRNATDLRFVGFTVLGYEVARGAILFAMGRTAVEDFDLTGAAIQPELDIRLPMILAGVVVVVAAEVFRQGAVMRSDLEAAREIQFSLVPAPDFNRASIVIHSWMDPARTVGGDYYDVIELNDDSLGFVVADVAGKGLPAALLMALLQGSLRSLLASGQRGAELIRSLNAYLCANTPDNRLVTCFYGELDPSSAVLRYVNAGHNPPFLERGAGAERLGATGPVLGAIPEAEYSEGEARFEPGTRLVLFTDGISEAANRNGDEFGDERLRAVLSDHQASSPQQVVAGVAASVARFCAGAPQGDDMTMMVVSRSA